MSKIKELLTKHSRKITGYDDPVVVLIAVASDEEQFFYYNYYVGYLPVGHPMLINAAKYLPFTGNVFYVDNTQDQEDVNRLVSDRNTLRFIYFEQARKQAERLAVNCDCPVAILPGFTRENALEDLFNQSHKDSPESR